MSVEYSGNWAVEMGREYLGAAGVVTIKGSDRGAVYPLEPLGCSDMASWRMTPWDDSRTLFGKHSRPRDCRDVGSKNIKESLVPRLET